MKSLPRLRHARAALAQSLSPSCALHLPDIADLPRAGVASTSQRQSRGRGGAGAGAGDGSAAAAEGEGGEAEGGEVPLVRELALIIKSDVQARRRVIASDCPLHTAFLA